MTDEREETRDAGAGAWGRGGGQNRLLVDSAPALSSAVHKQTLINRRTLFFFLSVAPLENNLELGAPKRDCSENDTGRMAGERGRTKGN